MSIEANTLVGMNMRRCRVRLMRHSHDKVHEMAGLERFDWMRALGPVNHPRACCCTVNVLNSDEDQEALVPVDATMGHRFVRNGLRVVFGWQRLSSTSFQMGCPGAGQVGGSHPEKDCGSYVLCTFMAIVQPVLPGAWSCSATC